MAVAVVTRRERKRSDVRGKPRGRGEQMGIGSAKGGIGEALEGGGGRRGARGCGASSGSGNGSHDWESSAHLVHCLSSCFDVLHAVDESILQRLRAPVLESL